MQTPHVTDPDFENFPPQSSAVDRVLTVLGISRDTKANFGNCFTPIDPVKHIQKDWYFLFPAFCSVLDQFSWRENPDTSRLVKFSYFLRKDFENCFFFQTLQSISKNKLFLLKYVSSLVPFYEIFYINLIVKTHLSYHKLFLQIHLSRPSKRWANILATCFPMILSFPIT